MYAHPGNALPAGFDLNEYRILSVLGDGGFGITYRAEDVNLGKQVAIKEYLPVELAIRRGTSNVEPRSTGTAEDFSWGLREFLREAQTLARFEHPNIVPVLRFFEANGTAYIVMAFQEGRSLFEMIQRGGLSQGDIDGMLPALLDGLAAVHAGGYLHRDIKPENIFIRRDGTPVLIDFGAARQALGNRTQSLTSIVSRGYAPFEQYTKEGPQGPWSDIYALGAVLYAAITGEPPPDATDRKQRDTMAPAVEVGRGQFPEPFLRAIDWALEVAAEDRPQSLAEWRAALYGAPSSRRVEGATMRPGDTLRPPSGRRQRSGPMVGALLGGLAVLVLAATAAAVWYLAPPSADSARPPTVAQDSGPVAADAERRAREEAQRRKADAARRQAAEEERARAEAEVRRRADAEARARAEEKARRRAEEEARRQAEEAARQRAKAEQAERRRAEAEARARAEEEARRRADAEARARAEEEASRRADAEARARAEEEARRRADEEARERAEAEARRRADEEARRRAEEAARQRAQAEQAERRRAETEAKRRAEEAARRQAEKAASAPSPSTTRPAATGATPNPPRRAATQVPQQAARPDPGAALRALFAGATVYATTRSSHPVRRDVWRFASDGSVAGTYSEAAESWVMPETEGTDRGRWWVEGERLCLQWSDWDDGQRHCYRVSGTGPNYVASEGGGLLEGRFELRK
ncbi:MAG: serine/threonine-protein kinase [Alphaproteobacteria bacterium]|nr:serine/threonine-protein kinase [Alphaproteobacteria bacterium]